MSKELEPQRQTTSVSEFTETDPSILREMVDRKRHAVSEQIKSIANNPTPENLIFMRQLAEDLRHLMILETSVRPAEYQASRRLYTELSALYSKIPTDNPHAYYRTLNASVPRQDLLETGLDPNLVAVLYADFGRAQIKDQTDLSLKNYQRGLTIKPTAGVISLELIVRNSSVRLNANGGLNPRRNLSTYDHGCLDEAQRILESADIRDDLGRMTIYGIGQTYQLGSRLIGAANVIAESYLKNQNQQQVA